jgi:opacity protein-like surface antigen
LALVLAATGEARAQGFISPFAGYNFGGDAGCPQITGCQNNQFNWGVTLGVTGSVFGFEEEFAYAKDFFGSSPGFSSSVLTVMTNVMLIPNVGPVRPYALAGLGLIKTHIELSPSSLFSGDNNGFGWDVGGGVMVLFARHFGVRGDLRYFHSFQDTAVLGVLTLNGEKLDFGRVSGAVVFRF